MMQTRLQNTQFYGVILGHESVVEGVSSFLVNNNENIPEEGDNETSEVL